MTTIVAPTMPGPRWTIGNRDADSAARLERELGVPSIVAALLVQRGYTEPAEADRFLNPSLDHLHDPRTLPDYEAAKIAILGARERKELIFVHGDYDVDGVTSAALLNRFLTRIGCEVHTHVPHRMKEGYGIHRSAVEYAKQRGAKLFLTCDCGVAAHEQVAVAREAGMSVVVTDHHSIAGDLPDADAVINPHRADSIYPFRELCGAGVVFKLCQGLCLELDIDVANYHRAYLDLAVLGTVADVMPLCGENRVIAKFGLQRLTETKKPGLRALMREAGITLTPGKFLRPYNIGFELGPRLNAAGRIEDAALSLQLLLESDEARAADIARKIESINSERRQEQQRVVEEASTIVLERGLHERNVIVVAGDGWHPGILGIAAGRIAELYRRPTFVLAIDRDNGVCRGSARSIPGFDLAASIVALPSLFLGGGGHAMAAGCSVAIDMVETMADGLHAYASEFLTEEDFVPTMRADFEVDFDEVTLPAVEALAAMEPFGLGNPEPVFVARKVSFAQMMPTKNPSHMRLTLRSGRSRAIDGIAFGLGERLSKIGAGSAADLLFCAEINEFRGSRSLQWKIKDYVDA
jgi:single-stranded-DNA-specific exonuclease